MPDDLRTLLERAEAPSMRVDPHAVLDRGRRRHRRRAALATTALAAAVGVLAVGSATVGDLGTKALRPASAVATTSSGPAASSTATQPPKPVTARVRIEVGHCWVEDVVFDGQTWGLTDADQFGTGGGVPLRWEGTGVMARLSAERARYTDDTGTVLNFLPVGDPSVFRMNGRGCL